MTFFAINWNKIEDLKDIEIWNRVTSNFWLPEKIPVSQDLPSWSKLTDEEKETTRKVFAGLTLLDTIQGSIGAPALMEHAQTQHEEAVYANFSFMEQVHAKSYSTIFSTLCSTQEINDVFRWAAENPQLQRKAEIITEVYRSDDPLKKMIASTLLESFLFYSGFYWSLKLAASGKLTNSADIIRLILSDEAIHGYYIGYKFAQRLAQETSERQEELTTYAVDLMMDLYENELQYTRDLYDDLGWTEDVVAFLHYNANKAFMNLGLEPVFPEAVCNFSSAIRSQLNPTGDENHDFFSGAGAGYVMGKVETTEDDDWEF